jgi:tRNA threonylcarbamoyladenosine modification (KEOPS) complex  Pcc1 subunit
VISATVEAGFSSAARARAAALAVSAGFVEGERAKSSVKAAGKRLVVRVEASDAVALRAALNTHLRLLSAARAGLDGGVADG